MLQRLVQFFEPANGDNDQTNPSRIPSQAPRIPPGIPLPTAPARRRQRAKTGGLPFPLGPAGNFSLNPKSSLLRIGVLLSASTEIVAENNDARRAKVPARVREAPTIEETRTLLAAVPDLHGLNRGINQCAIQQVMGHKSQQTTMGYFHAENLSVHCPLDFGTVSAGERLATRAKTWTDRTAIKRHILFAPNPLRPELVWSEVKFS